MICGVEDNENLKYFTTKNSFVKKDM